MTDQFFLVAIPAIPVDPMVVLTEEIKQVAQEREFSHSLQIKKLEDELTVLKGKLAKPITFTIWADQEMFLSSKQGSRVITKEQICVTIEKTNGIIAIPNKKDIPKVNLSHVGKNFNGIIKLETEIMAAFDNGEWKKLNIGQELYCPRDTKVTLSPGRYGYVILDTTVDATI